jgi:hypothetical protein
MSRGGGGAIELGKLFGRLMKKKGSWWEEWEVSANTWLGKDDNKNNKDPKQISARKQANGMILAERETKIDRVTGELDDSLEQEELMMGQLEGKDMKTLELQNLAKEKEGEILELQKMWDRKEHRVVWVETQLKKAWIDLLEAAIAVQTAKKVHVEAKVHESKIHSKLKETLAAMEEMMLSVAVLESCEKELRHQLGKSEVMEGGVVF